MIIKTISMCMTCLNEIRFIGDWLDNALTLADEVCIIDGGSTDGTIETIKRYEGMHSKIHLIVQPQEGRPYVDWQEGKVKQLLIDMANEHLVIVTGADELICYSKREEILHYANQFRHLAFRLVPFWGDIRTVRVNTENDEHWNNYAYRAFWSKQGYYEKTDGNHAKLRPWGTSLTDSSIMNTYIPLFHYHYVYPAKENDNRRGELGPDGTDFQYITNHPELFPYKLATESYVGEHAKILGVK